MVTGLDLVEWQLRVAAGEPLPLAQDEIKMSGHALEARIYAENPDNNFLPSTGTVHFINHPTESTTVRVDSGITTGDEISPYYDPMISKLVVIGSDRQDAIWKMHCALDEYAILGIRNNVSFLNRLVMDADFQKPALHTRLIEERLEQLIAAPDEQDELLGFAALYIYLANRQAQQDHQRHQDDQWSPWVGADNPGHDDVPGCKLLMGYGDERREVEVSRSGQLFRLDSHGEPLAASLVTQHTLEISTQEGSQQLFVARDGANIYLHHRGHNALVFYIDRLDQSGSAGDVTGTLNSPMPGSVVDVAVTQGQKVASGDNLMTIEAMKMEHRIRSPHDGIVTAINFAVGDKVDEGAALMVIE
jgi:3-methylcrotonyl-CoA carboxylase alpha subunit